ncbi:MAG: hypothetical protein KKB51_11310 [Candidatus Riflebacteria bacterium]|nr:hypothetical protein [Candidatus Riflebacteria bacterium]
MNKKKIVWVLAGIPVLLLVGWLVKILLFPVTENQKIEQAIRNAAAVFETKNSKSLITFLTSDFPAHPQMDRESMLNYLKMFFFQARDLKVSIEHLKHEVEKLPNTASETRVLVVAKVTGVIDGQQFQAFSGKGVDAVVLTMQKLQGKWLIASARNVDISDPGKAFEQIIKK